MKVLSVSSPPLLAGHYSISLGVNQAQNNSGVSIYHLEAI